MDGVGTNGDNGLVEGVEGESFKKNKKIKNRFLFSFSISAVRLC